MAGLRGFPGMFNMPTPGAPAAPAAPGIGTLGSSPNPMTPPQGFAPRNPFGGMFGGAQSGPGPGMPPTFMGGVMSPPAFGQGGRFGMQGNFTPGGGGMPQQLGAMFGMQGSPGDYMQMLRRFLPQFGGGMPPGGGGFRGGGGY